MKVGFIGLGSMGLPMATNLLKAGHDLIVYNRTRAHAEELAKQGARVAGAPREAVEDRPTLDHQGLPEAADAHISGYSWVAVKAKVAVVAAPW